MKKIINLRGHHIATLGEIFWDRIFPNESKFPNKRRDKLVLKSNFSYHNNEGLIKREKLICSQLIGFYTKIKIVEGLDSFCLPDCVNRNNSCSSISAINEDNFYLKEYNLEVGKIYDAEMIMKKIKEYPGKNGYEYETPRYKLLLENLKKRHEELSF
jgi:hypothetical protein